MAGRSLLRIGECTGYIFGQVVSKTQDVVLMVVFFFFCHRHGAQGLLDGASKGTLESEFGTSNEDECMIKILERGDYQTSTVSSFLLSRRWGNSTETNIFYRPMETAGKRTSVRVLR